MKLNRIILVCMAFLTFPGFLFFQGCGQVQSDQDGSVNQSATPDPNLPFTYSVKSIVRLANFAMRPQWSFDGQWVVFDRTYSSSVTGSTRWQVFRIKSDGTNEECLTCNRTGNPGHNGGPHLSPDGRYVVFSAEKLTHPALPGNCPSCADPGAGLYNDVAVLDLQTQVITRLTNVSTNALAPGGSMHPRFSYDGKKIMWSDFEGGTSELGNYRIAVANFNATPTPNLTNITYYNPGPKPEMMESQGFSPDGKKIYFTCTGLQNQSDLTADICELNLDNQQLNRVTKSSGLLGELTAYEEHGAHNPQYSVFAYMSSGDYGVNLSNLSFLSWLKTDIWISNIEGTQSKQVTFFNKQGYPESQASRTIVSKLNWDPTGKKIVASVWKVGQEGNSADDIIEIVIIEF